MSCRLVGVAHANAIAPWPVITVPFLFRRSIYLLLSLYSALLFLLCNFSSPFHHLHDVHRIQVLCRDLVFLCPF